MAKGKQADDNPAERIYWEATVRIPRLDAEPDTVTIHGSATSHLIAAVRAVETREALHDALFPRQSDGNRDELADEQPADA